MHGAVWLFRGAFTFKWNDLLSTMDCLRRLVCSTLAGGPAQGKDGAVTGPLRVPVVVVVCLR